MPPPLGSHTRPTHYRAGRLVVTADSPTWATMIRHQRNALIRRLRQYPELAGLAHIHIRVSPARATRPPLRKAAVPLPTKTSGLLNAAANDIRDPRLKAALRKLARRTDG